MKVASGELSPGTRLPSVRGLAVQLTVNTTTVAKAYAELSAEGVIESRHGVGVFVAEPRQLLSEEERERRLAEALKLFVSSVVSLGFEPEEVLDRLAAQLAPFAPRVP
ncbi:MAG: GntR family transcriptional regulator [Acidobacteria bacterium]|nr:GntR family transcriptional regulator [Acidobacteriota bacterium]